MLKRFISYYKPHKKLFIMDMFCAAMLAGIDLVFPFVTRLFMNDFIPNNNTQAMLAFAILLVFLVFIRLACNYFVLFWGHIMGARIERDIRKDLFTKIQSLDIAYFDENQTPKLMSRLVGDLRDISEAAHHLPEDIFISVVMVTGTTILLLFINVTLTLIMIPIVLGIISFMFYMRKAMGKANKALKVEQAEINASIGNSLGGIRLMKSFANEKRELARFTFNNEKYYESWFSFYRIMGVFHGTNNFLIDLANVMILVTGSFFILRSSMSIGDMTAFFLYLNFLIQPIRRLMQFMELTQSAAAGFGRFCEIMDIETSINTPENAKQLTHPNGKIECKHVHFSYQGENTHVLNDFSLTIPAGSKVALVGESGVGKSTLSQLIPRYYDVSSGVIKIDDVDIRKLDLFSLREAIGHVSQDVYMFYDNILENIRYGKLEASDEEVIEAAKKANIHEFIMSLEEGYQTSVGERGVKLSGGQKQRIAIARVFLKNPKILILDEATSALDNITEQLIQASIEELSKGKTVITIAHRLSTVKHADEIIVLGKEGIAERGKHEELVQSGGYYAKLWHV